MKTKEMNEVWINIEGYENLYKISNMGKVKSLSREVNGKNGSTREHVGKELAKLISSNGYQVVRLSKEGKATTYTLHSLMAKNFLRMNLNDKTLIINHKDSNPKNNQLNNLEIVSYRENACHAQLQKTRSCEHIGVSYNKKEGKYKSSITFNGKQIGLGTYLNEEDAYQARVNFERVNNITNKYLA